MSHFPYCVELFSWDPDRGPHRTLPRAIVVPTTALS
jgi:hypothetical protein